jgi:hypothetical protein
MPHRNDNPVGVRADDFDSTGYLAVSSIIDSEEMIMVSWKVGLAYLLLAGLVAVGTSLWSRRAATGRCEQDGQELSAALRVDLEMADGTRHQFCSIECARRWLAGQSGAVLKAAVVRDALTGEPIDSYVAFFVRSKIVTNRSNGNNIHAFRYRTDAMDHIRRFGGELIADPLAAP